MNETPPKSPKPSFADFRPQQREGPEHLRRESFQGLSPEDAADRLVRFLEGRKDFRRITLDQKRVVLRKMLSDFQKKGLDLGTISTSDTATYREYLRELVDRGLISESYAGHVVAQWDSTVRAAFGEKGKPGEGLLMRGFRQHVRMVEHLTEEDFAALLSASRQILFEEEHYRELFLAYLELAWSTGSRIGSLLGGNLRVADLDFERQVARFRHMKNVPEHTAVLTPRAAMRLRAWADRLSSAPSWNGPETPVFVGPSGNPVASQWINRKLKQAAARAGIRKPISTHVIRKSVGTLMGRENPKLAQLQLGITAKVFNAHYNQPLLEDRLAKRNILPGSGWKPRTPEEIAGSAALAFESGRLSREEYERQIGLARSMKSTPETGTYSTPGYA